MKRLEEVSGVSCGPDFDRLRSQRDDHRARFAGGGLDGVAGALSSVCRCNYVLFQRPQKRPRSRAHERLGRRRQRSGACRGRALALAAVRFTETGHGVRVRVEELDARAVARPALGSSNDDQATPALKRTDFADSTNDRRTR